MATETKKVSKLDEVLNKIDAFFSNLMSAKKEDDMEEGDDLGAATADDEPEAEATPAPAAKKAKKATDEEDSQDPDDDDDDDSDPEKDNDDDAYAKKAAATIAKLKATIKEQNTLLAAAKDALSERDEDVRETIKSTFKPASSQRSTKVAVKNELPSWAQPQTELGKKAAKMVANKSNKR